MIALRALGRALCGPQKLAYDVGVSSPHRLHLCLVAALALLGVSSIVVPTPARAEAPTLKNGGTLVVAASTIGAEVFIDGERVGTTPLAGPIALSVDEHTLKIVKPGFAPLIDVIKIQRRKVSKIEVDLTPVAGILRVKSNVNEARVFVDGKFVGQAPLEVEIPVGACAIQVSRGGFKDFFRNIESVAGQEVSLEVTLDALPAELNPYVVKAAPPARWYEKWWVWTVGVAGVAVVVTAVAVPVALSQRDPIQGFGPSYTYTVNGSGTASVP